MTQMYPVHIPAKNPKVILQKAHYGGGTFPTGLLTDDFKEWMNTQVGPQGRDIMSQPAWYFDPSSHWYKDPSGVDKSFAYYTVWLRDGKHHLLMKLTWGGSV